MDMKEENIHLKIKLLNNEISEYKKEKLRFSKILKSIPSKLEFNTNLVIELEMRSIKTKKESITRYFYCIKESYEENPEILDNIEQITFTKSRRNLRHDIAIKTHIDHCKEQINRMNKLDEIISTKYEQCIQEIGFAQREIEELHKELDEIPKGEEQFHLSVTGREEKTKNKGITERIEYWGEKLIPDKNAKLKEEKVNEICDKLREEGFDPNHKSVHSTLNKKDFGKSII